MAVKNFIDKSFRLCYNKNTEKNIPTMSVEKNKRSSHRVVARGTLCVFKILIKKEKEGHYDYTT